MSVEGSIVWAVHRRSQGRRPNAGELRPGKPVVGGRWPSRRATPPATSSANAGLLVEVGRRVAAVYEAVRGAASADPEVRPVWEEIRAERRIGAAHVVADTAAKGPLRAGIDLEAAADVVWVLNAPGLYHLLVHVRGWPNERYRNWVVASLQHELLAAR
jgi:hypothetical protein